MKKRVLSLFMALALCLTLLPTAALADELGPVDGTSTVETAGADAEAEAKAKAGAEAVATVQALIDALPAVDELDGMDDEDAMAAYDAVQAAYDAYEALTEAQKAEITGADRFEALFGWFNEQVATLAGTETQIEVATDGVDADGTINSNGFRANCFALTDELATGTLSRQYYMVQSDMTINGNLTVDGTDSGGLVLCDGATLTVNGALIHQGGSSFFIYGQTLTESSKGTGKLVIKNSLDSNGAAIRATGNNAQLGISSGEVTINAGKSGKLVEGVKLYSTNKIHTATLDAKKVSPDAWSDNTSIEGTSLVLEYCDHDDADTVWIKDDDTQHHWQCKACGFTSTAKVEHAFRPVERNTETHTMKCDLCRYEAAPAQHHFKDLETPEATSDGKGHTTKMCEDCSYTSGEAEAHKDWDEQGACGVCGFKPILEGKTGNLYDDLATALDEGETALTLVSYATGDANKGIVKTNLEFDRNATITLDMGGCTLENSTGGATITVASGTLTVKGEATIKQTGTAESASSAVRVTGGTLIFDGKLTATGANSKPAVEVTSGSLVFEDAVTATGGKSSSAASPAIEVTGGTVEFNGALNLDGGLFLDSCERLASKLTQGSFYSDNNDQGQVYRVQIKNDSQHSYDLLADGYAFAKYDKTTGKAKVDGNGNPVLVSAKLSVLPTNTDVIIVEHKHSIEEGQSACACGRQFEAGVTAEDGTITYYETIDEAFANVKANETVKLMMDSDDRDRDYIYVVGGPYTFDLNGHRVGHRTGDDFNQAFLQVGDTDGKPGTLTVLDSSTAQTGYFYELKLYNGSLTVESGSFYRYWESATTATGTMTFKGGTVDEFYATSANVETKLYGGTFGNVYNNIGGKPGDLLADNRAFFNRGNNSLVNGYDYKAVSDVVVKEHTHNIEGGSCECGFTCAHDWSDKNGVCKKANCGYHCPHNAGAAEADGVWACNTCGQTVTAKVVAPDGSTTTYYADGHVDNNVKSGLYFAIKAAKTGSTVAALGGEYSGGYVKGGKTLTLDVSNGKTIDGMLNVGYTNTGDTGDTGNTGNKLIVRGSAEISYVIVEPDNTLDLTGWTGRIVSLTVQNSGKATLNGGTFATLYINGATAGSLLAKGYAFQNAATGAYVECSSTADMENVKVVKCPHSGVTLKEDHTGAECKYCGASFAATLDDAPYDKIDAAVTDWLENGGTLKLYADYTAATEKATWTIGSGSHTVDLNGHKMSVEGDGSAFFKPTHNMHLTVTNSKEIGQITNILLDGSQNGSFTLKSGYVGNLKMTGGAVVTLEGGRVDKLDVKNCSENTNLSIQGGSLGELNIEDWADGMHVSATGGSLGAYTLPRGKILADVLDHQYYAEGTGLDRQEDTAQPTEEFVIKQAPYDFGSATSKVANVPINGRIPFRVDSPSENAGVYLVKWCRRTNSGAVHMVENKVAGVNVGDKLDVFCVITGVDRPINGNVLWQVAVKDYTINVVPAKLNDDRTVIRQKPDTGNTGNPADNRLVVTPLASNTFNYVDYKFEVTYNGQPLELNKDYTIKGLSNLAKNAGTHTLTIVGTGNYTGEKSVTWTLEPYELSVENFCPAQINKAYDGTDAVTDSTNGIGGLGSFIPDSKNPRNPGLPAVNKLNLDKSDYQLSNMKFDSAEAGDRTFTGTMTLKPDGNFAFAGGSRVMQIEYGSVSGQQFFFIDRATIAAPAAKALQVANNHAATYTVDLSALLPKLESPKKYGEVTYTLDTVSINGGYYDAAKGNAEVKDGKLILPIQAVQTDTTGSIGSVKVKVSTTNYHDFTLTVNLRSVNKRKLGMFVSVATDPVVYGMTLGDIKLSAEATVDKQVIPGTIAWEDPLTTVPAAGRATYRWTFTPDDTMHYLTASNTITFLVDKATPTGAPTYTAITTGGKTLADAALKSNASWPTGTIQWVDKDGKVLPDTTEVKANTAYKWIFTPTGADAANYTTAEGTVILYSVSTGGSSSGSTVKTDTVTNPDGSVTKTETKSDGTKVETTTGKDGSVSKTTTNPNGSSVTENKAADGSTGTVKTDKNGQTTAETTLSGKAVEDAKKNGEPVKAPVEVEASRNSNTAPTVKVELPKNSGDTKVEIPVTNVKPGTVAVIVHADGTEEIVKNSLPTEDGIQLTVNGGATVKIVDNSKDFADTRNHWAKDAIDFVSARGLLNGTSANTFSPNAPTTRAQLWTVLARQADADLIGGATWYENAQNWAKEKGISDGTNPNGTINRAQMVTMLWRTMGQPAAASGASFADVPADSYYAQAVAWAVENGITAGVGGGRFDPNSTCTRAQIATFLWRAMAE